MKHLSSLIGAGLSAALLAACSGNHSVPTTVSTARLIVPGFAPAWTSRGSIVGPDLYVANGGGKNGTGDVTTYGLRHGKLLQTLSGIDKPSVIGFDSGANLIAVANTEPQKAGKSGSVALYSPGSKTPASVLKGTSDPVALAFDAAGKVYVANRNGGIGIYKPGRPRPIRIISGNYSGYYGVYRPQLLALDPSGNLYVANGPRPYGSQDSVLLLSIFPPGKSQSEISVEIGKPRALLITQGLVYIACAPRKTNKRNPDGWVKVYQLGLRSLPLTITEGIRTPDALAVDASGNLYVANLNGHNVTVYASGSTKPFRVITEGVSSPKALAIGPEGNLYVANLYQNSVSMYKPGESKPFLTITQGISTPVAVTLNAP